ncbi:hypothetical protein SAMN05421821_101755 [Mucilaginibacter lappiensis]|uniref:Type VI secretion system needle protein Hcp n=1 Tax=Mucilaginibacter lappiensis TaxID=354630 RepID=A0ABR6PC42_9SPHI|nr:type VI secretion system tube protein TssD [Mucilaginibacter lappiensis]MBB6107322.1 hypothetical protein [Mucilaginibacter lappiensis]SIQ12359.1 hypothetical protein SAMN05421821_101755 [Mucilaginibacter lappiensis]
MAFKARLNFSGRDYDVLTCSYALDRDVDSKGRPSSGVYGGKIEVEIESTEDTSIIETMVNSQFKSFKGTLLIKKSEEDAKMKELTFEDSYIIAYDEGINIVGEVPMSMRFVISARTLKVGDAEHINDWPGKN